MEVSYHEVLAQSKNKYFIILRIFYPAPITVAGSQMELEKQKITVSI